MTADTTLTMLKTYLEARIKIMRAGGEKNKAHGPKYDQGVLNTYILALENISRLKVYLESRKTEAIRMVWSEEYRKGVDNAIEWLEQLLNEPATLKTYYDKAIEGGK